MHDGTTQKMIGNFVLSLFLISPIYAQSSNNNGSICLASIEAPNGGEKSLANPSGENRIQAYEVQIDKRSKIKASTFNSIKINGLAANSKHLVKIIGDGKVVESFSFKFKDYSSNKLCLWFKPLYETWSLWENKEAKGICHCR